MSMNCTPSGWFETTLGEIIELKYGKSLPAKVRSGEGCKVYGSNGVVGKHSEPLVLGPGIIIGRKGSFGEVHLSDTPFFPIDTTYFVDQLWEQPIKYWYYQLKNLPLTQLNRSSAIPGLNREDAYAQGIALPPLAEQKQIAAKLDELLAQVDTLKTRLDAIPAILKRFRQSVLAAAVSGRLTEEWRGSKELDGWVDGKLGDFVHKPSYGTSSKSQKEGDVPVLRMGNLQSGRLDWTDLVYTSDQSDIEKYKLYDGDVLFNRTNSPELVGKTSIYRGEMEAIYAGYLIRLQCKDKLNPEFLNYHLNSLGAKQYCYSVKSDGVSQSNINAQKLIAYPLSKPPVKEQTEIVRHIEHLFTFADQIEQRVKDAQSCINHITQSILAKAFRGELTADWREQNPDLISGENSAEALLNRIKAQRKSVPLKTRRRKKRA
ncbi:MAG: restriction endonuclease subunit S [Candidatus Thiodiazotropha endolucinida]|nr:restriction endonuclease subunit S [Candidatus Thiodiazotropha endolucinida]